MALTYEQMKILREADKSSLCPRPEDLKKVKGFHWCPDWDFLPICDDSPEADCCFCKDA